MRSLGKSLRAIRLIKGLTIEQVAKASDLSVSYIGRLERDERDPTWSTLKAIASALGVPVSTVAIVSEPSKITDNHVMVIETAELLSD